MVDYVKRYKMLTGFIVNLSPVFLLVFSFPEYTFSDRYLLVELDAGNKFDGATEPPNIPDDISVPEQVPGEDSSAGDKTPYSQPPLIYDVEEEEPRTTSPTNRPRKRQSTKGTNIKQITQQSSFI